MMRWLACLIAVALLACGCQREPASKLVGQFMLHPQGAHPVIAYDGQYIHLDWAGQPLFVTMEHARQGRQLATRYERGDRQLRELGLERFDNSSDDMLIASCLAPEMPAGWPRCLALTYMRDTAGHTSEAVQHKQFSAKLVDVKTGGLLAEIDLSVMHDSLYPQAVLPPEVIEVQSACTAPDGRIGLVVLFSWPGSFTTEWGVWDGSIWQPLTSRAPRGARWQGTVFPGPGGAVARWPDPGYVSIMPSRQVGAGGVVVWQLDPLALAPLKLGASWHFSLLGALTAAPAFFCIALLALLWLFIPARPQRAA